MCYDYVLLLLSKHAKQTQSALPYTVERHKALYFLSRVLVSLHF